MPNKRYITNLVRFCLLFYGGLWLIHVAVNFPYSTDRQTTVRARSEREVNFYSQAYAAPTAPTKEEQEKEEIYVRVAKRQQRETISRGW